MLISQERGTADWARREADSDCQALLTTEEEGPTGRHFLKEEKMNG